MRDIRFRAWLKEAKKLVPVHVIDFDDAFGWNIKYSSNMYAPFSEVELMQYTGLLDKNGKEIFEGDLIKMFDGQKLSAEVVFGWGEDNEMYAWSYGWCTKSPEDENGLIFGARPEDIKEWEVIGNIYENPELIKEKTNA